MLPNIQTDKSSVPKSKNTDNTSASEFAYCPITIPPITMQYTVTNNYSVGNKSYCKSKDVGSVESIYPSNVLFF